MGDHTRNDLKARVSEFISRKLQVPKLRAKEAESDSDQAKGRVMGA